MDNKLVYLKQNVQVEPLFNQWYAWSHLISPQTAAMNITNSHVKIMKSYVANPKIHANAVKNPAMLGGPFIDYEGGRVDEIKALLDRTLREQAHMIAFAESVKELNGTLMKEAKGYSLEPLYQKIPPQLKGYVELVYDLNNYPAVRFLEGLLYRSKYYDPSLQSLSLSLTERDGRPFALSTPRLPDAQRLSVNIPFAHPGIDELFRMKDDPRPFGYIRQRLGIAAEHEELFGTFFTEQAPRRASKFEGDGVRVRYFGHACVLVETQDVSILLDPLISYGCEHGIERLTFQDLPESIDYAVITHSHQDHVMFESLLQLRHKIKNLILPRSRSRCMEDPSLRLACQAVGFKNVREIDEMEVIELEGGSITGLPFFGEHCDLDISSKMAHLVELKNRKFLFAADSNNIEPALYSHLREVTGDVDVLYLGMECEGAPLSWLYGPLLYHPLDRRMDQSRRFSASDHDKGLDIVERFNCKEVYIYAMGHEPWLTYALSINYTDESPQIVNSNRLVATCRERGLTSERLFGKKETVYSPAA
jgi:L-ascorbate metabolism protein UlaG (beta-lactamase superfamily)